MINTVYNIDCMELLKDTPDKFYQLAIVDPPYGIGEDGSKNKNRTGGLAKPKDYKPFAGNDLSAPDVEYFTELIRVSKNQIIWGANHFISKIPFDSSCWIVWDKINGKTDFADCELAWTSFDTAVRKFTFRWSGMLQGDTSNKEVRIHPTQKPVALYKWILSKYANRGEHILDTHVGSGSSRIAAYDAGLDFTGCELDYDYWLAQEERFNNHKKQYKLDL